MIQTADGVLTYMDYLQKQDRISHEICDNIVDAGKTIILCAHHQKRIGRHSCSVLGFQNPTFRLTKCS